MKKRFLSILATLCLCLTLLPATALAESDSIDQAKFFVDSWGNLRDTLKNSTETVINAQLTKGITWEEGSIVIPEGKTVTLDLNGCKIDAQNNGTAIQVFGTLTINNSGKSESGMLDTGPAGGAIMNGTATSGSPAGGIYIAPGGQVTMNGGWIALCKTSLSNKVNGNTNYYGSGGVYISENASFTMNSGIIQDCTTEVTNPSNYVTAGSVVNNGTFTIGTYVNITYGYQSTIPKVPSVYNCENGIFTSNSDFVLGNITNKGTIQRTTSISNDDNRKGFAGTVTNRGSITGGKFSGTVTNNNLISGGTFLNTVSNGISSATISDGTFSSEVTNKGSITGGTFSGMVKNSQGRITNGTFTGTVENTNSGMLGKISGGDFSKAYITNGRYTVDITIGQNMTIRSGNAKQIGLIVQDMTPVVVTADNGYYFPTGYSVNEQYGVKVTRDSASQVKVSGMPCYNVNITLPAATAKTKAETPKASFTATGSDTGTLSNVDSGMQYSLDGSNWNAINGTIVNLTGLTSGTEIQIIKRGGETATDSDIQHITLTQAQTPTVSFAATGTSTGTLNGVSSDVQYRIGSGRWNDISGESAALTGLSNGTVIHVRTKGTGNALFSPSQDITLAQAEKPNASFTATDASTGTLSGVTAGMKYKIGDGGWNEISSNENISLNDLSACTISVMQSGGEKLDSETQTITVTKPNAPAVTAQNCINGNDGKLTDVNNTMEYRSSGAGSWTAIDGSEVPGLAAGSYEVRYKASGTALASAPQTVTIGSYAAQLTKSNNDVSYYNSLLEAVDAAKNNSGSTVKLLQNCTSGQISITNACNFTIDLNGKTINSTDTTLIRLETDRREQSIQLINTTASQNAAVHANQVVYLSQNSHLTIGKRDGSSNILFELSDTLFTAGDNSNGTTITIYGGTYKTIGDWAVSVQNKGAAATIYGGTFIGTNAGVRLHNNTSPNDTLTIYGGTFHADKSEGFGLRVSGSQSKALLQGGTYASICVTDSNSLSGILSAGYAYKNNTNGWVNDPKGNSLTKVTVQKAPVQNLSVTAAAETVYGQSVLITATPTLLDTSSEVSYKWYQGNTEIAGASESVYNTAVGLDAGSYTFRCEVSCDGYVTSKSVDLKVNKADCQITPPTAENLVYTGEEQALITAGKADGGTMQYCLTQDGTYSENVPTGGNAGEYTVWYKVAGDDNHNNTKPASVSVTIARQPVDVPKEDATVFTYDGEKKTYTIAENDNYTAANTEQTNAGTYTVTVTLNDTENFVWNDQTDAAKEYPFVIAPAKVTVTIKDKSAYVGSKTAPDLSKPEEDKDYTISGLIGEDTLTGSVKLKYDPAPDLTKVSDTTQIVDNSSTLKNSNYTVTYIPGKLTIVYPPDPGPSTVKTETSTNPDGSTTKTETKSDGTVVETTTNKDGSTAKTETKKDGSSVTESKAADGSTGRVKTDKNGKTEAAAKVSEKAVADAKKSGEAVSIPIEVKAEKDSNSAPIVKVEMPKSAGETKIEIPVSNVTAGTIAVRVHEDGTEEMIKDSVPTETGVQLTVSGNATVKILDNSKDFVDTRSHWAKDAIDFVSARELVVGVSESAYAPDESTTRAQLWTILARQDNANLTGGDNWYEKAQNWAKANDVSDGTDPTGNITREQLVAMLYRYAGSPAAKGSLDAFADSANVSAYAVGAMQWAVENGIVNGSDGKLNPRDTATRAEVAMILMGFCGMSK